MIITFTGGDVYDTFGELKGVTNEQDLFFEVGSYVEQDFLIQYNSIGSGEGQTIGDYYGFNNDVIHGHWDGELQNIEISRLDNNVFDLEYFSLTSNTEVGGGAATGNEKIYIEGFDKDLKSTGSFLIPSEDWGGEFQDVFLGDAFNEVTKVTIAGDGAFCYGMDSFVIDQSAAGVSQGNGTSLSPTIPEVSHCGIILGVIALLLTINKRR